MMCMWCVHATLVANSVHCLSKNKTLLSAVQWLFLNYSTFFFSSGFSHHLRSYRKRVAQSKDKRGDWLWDIFVRCGRSTPAAEGSHPTYLTRCWPAYQPSSQRLSRRQCDSPHFFYEMRACISTMLAASVTADMQDITFHRHWGRWVDRQGEWEKYCDRFSIHDTGTISQGGL